MIKVKKLNYRMYNSKTNELRLTGVYYHNFETLNDSIEPILQDHIDNLMVSPMNDDGYYFEYDEDESELTLDEMVDIMNGIPSVVFNRKKRRTW